MNFLIEGEIALLNPTSLAEEQVNQKGQDDWGENAYTEHFDDFDGIIGHDIKRV